MVIERSQDPDAFAAFELVGWDANIAGYDQAFGVVARQAVSPILEATHVGSGTRVLDVCCGPGILAAGALARGADVIGLDFASEAVALARRIVPFGRSSRATRRRCPSLMPASMRWSAATVSCTCRTRQSHSERCYEYCVRAGASA